MCDDGLLQLYLIGRWIEHDHTMQYPNAALFLFDYLNWNISNGMNEMESVPFVHDYDIYVANCGIVDIHIMLINSI